MSKKSTVFPARGLYPQLELATAAPKEVQVLLVGIVAKGDGFEVPASSLLDDAHLATVQAGLASVGATGKAEEITRIPAPEGLSAKAVVAVGLGKKDELDDETLRRASGVAARAVAGDETVATNLGQFGVSSVVEGLILGGYSYRGLRSSQSEEEKAEAVNITVVSDNDAAAEEFSAAHIVAEAVVQTRDWVNTPSSFKYPKTYAKVLRQASEEAGLKVEVLDEKELKKQGFGGILAVGQGSERSPRLVRISYEPQNAKTSVALVGKGITFDTGGISLKPASNMENMISDMGGSAALAGAVIAAAKLELPIKVTATLALAENMPSGSASRPGDVITHYGGITSEIINTDAEGRVVLADALARASEDEPDYLIESSTLTGAQIVSLGNRTAGVMGTDKFRDTVAEAGRAVGENAWAMPLLEEHAEDIKSPIADIRNTSNSRDGGMLFAGTYLSKFVGEGIEWAHIDIAGPSFNTKSTYGYTPARATGTPLRTVIKVLQDLAK